MAEDGTTIVGAIAEVLSASVQPLSAKEIYSRIMELGLYTFHAQNPQHVVTSQLRRQCKDLEFPSARRTKLFRLTPDGKFALLPRPIKTHRAGRRGKSGRKDNLSAVLDNLKDLHSRYRDMLKLRILKDLKRMSPGGFEAFSRSLLEQYGFVDMEVTQISKDGGIDGHGRLRVGLAFMRVAFQCKRWRTTNVAAAILKMA